LNVCATRARWWFAAKGKKCIALDIRAWCKAKHMGAKEMARYTGERPDRDDKYR
jgi:hypothetical protein